MRTRTAALVFVLLGLCVFGRSLLPGRLFVPMHTERLEPWRSELAPERSRELAQGEYAAQSDKLISFRADDAITIEAVRHGRLPLWNPTNAGGVPHLAQGLYGALYPPHLLFALLSPEHAYGWLALLHHVLAALFMFLWLRKLGAGDVGALIGGIAFSFSGTLLGRAHYYQYIETLTWLPLGLWCVEHWFEGRRVALFALAPLTGLVLLVAWPQLAAFVLNAWAIVVLIKALRSDLLLAPRHLVGGALVAIALAVACAPLLPDRLIAWALWPHVALAFVFTVGPGRKVQLPEGAKPRRAFLRRLGAFGAVLGLGAAIAAIQYLPAAEWTAYGSRQLSGAPEAQCAAGLRPWYLVAAVLPDVFGTPSWSLLDSIFNLPRMFALDSTDEVLRQEQLGNTVENALYVGVSTLVLALFGILGARERRGMLLTVLVVFCGIALGAQAIVYPAFFLFPGLQISPDSRRALVLVAPFLAALAAFGVRTILERPRFARTCAIGLASIGAVALGCRWALDDATLLAPLLAHADHLARLFGQAGTVPEHAQNEVVAAIRGSLESSGIVALLSAIALFLATRATDERMRWFPLVLVLAADLTVHAWPRTAAQPAEGFLGPHPAISHLQQAVGTSGRIARFNAPERPQGLLGVALSPNLAGCYGLLDAWCYTVSPPKGWMTLAATGFGPSIDQGVALGALSTSEQLASPALDALAVRAILGVGEPPQELPTGITLAGRFGSAFVLMNERARPRVELVADAVVLDAAVEWSAAARTVLDATPGTRVHLGVPGIPVDAPAPLADTDGTLPIATIVDETTPERVVVKLEGGTRDGWLLLRDSYAPGWHAKVDGKSAQVHPGDLAFRAVFAPSGATEVVFEYEPASIAIGRAVSFLALVVSLLLLGLGLRRDRGR
ncbi:MAG: hypothetical protein IPH13_19695 [Planctomycetes bacterium]|nr:hypothetical protein [Planctomycetota bacterium]MCC7169514.1 hypothetical protein [Planctomycetota bacterium]